MSIKFPKAELVGVDSSSDPIDGMEYVFTYDVPYMGDGGTKVIPKGTVVIDVKKQGREIGYTIKSSGLRQTTYYPWLLAENTPENVAQLRVWWSYQNLRDLAQTRVNQEEKKLKTIGVISGS